MTTHQHTSLDEMDVHSWVYIKRIENNLLNVRLGIFLTQLRQPIYIKRKIGRTGGICLEISGTLIGIRSDDAKKIFVEPIPSTTVAKICD